MKTITTVKWIAALMLAASLTANAQGPGGVKGGRGGLGGQHQRPSPEQIAAQLMKNHDANKDGELSQDELTQALEALRKNHPQGTGGGGQGGGTAGASQGNQEGQQGVGQGDLGGKHQGPPPADKVAAQMIEKFSSDKKGLTQAELTKALEWRRANRDQHRGGGQQGGGQPGGAGTGSTNQTSSASGN